MACCEAQAEVRLAHIFTNHMVLQRQHAIPVWGWARPGEKISVEFNRQSARTTADAQGRWRVDLNSEVAGGPYSLKVTGDNKIILNDVLMGDVWLAGGQSNMEWTVAQSNNSSAELAQSDLPLIRHIKIPKGLSFQQAGDIGESFWKVSNPANTGEFTAAGYFFARQIQQETGVPIGIINASLGGTNIENWISREALATRPEFNMAAMPADAAAYNKNYRRRMQDVIARWQAGAPFVEISAPVFWKEADFDDSAWAALHTPQYWEEQGLEGLDGVVWYRRSIALTAQQAASGATLHLGKIDDCDETFVNGQSVGGICDWDKPRSYDIPPGLLKPGKNGVAVRVTDTGADGGFHGEAAAMQLKLGDDSIALDGSWKARVESIKDKSDLDKNDLPALLYNAMVSPLTNFPIKGVIWYQGENNAPRARQYAQTFPLLINDWRARWRQPNMPFYFVQLASFFALENNSLAGSDWAELRDAQLHTLKVHNTGMVVATDIGDAKSIHPLNKQAVGQRLALLAMKHDYGRKEIVSSGPIYRSLKIRGAQEEISFSEVGHGLVAGKGEATLRGFTVADEHHQFLPAQARIQGNKVIVSRPDMAHPLAVRYGWVSNPEESNLFNRDGLPASPFRTDDWPGLTDGVNYQF